MNEKINLIICPRCQVAGLLGFRHCPDCRGWGVGLVEAGRFFYWGKNLQLFGISSRRLIKFFQKAISLFFFILFFSLLILFILGEVKQIFPNFFSTDWDWIKKIWSVRLLWWALLVFLFLIQHQIRQQFPRYKISKTNGQTITGWLSEVVSWETIFTFKNKQRQDVSLFFTNNASKALEGAVKIASQRGSETVEALDVFLSLLDFTAVSNVLVRFDLPSKELKKLLTKDQNKNSSKTSPSLSSDVWQIIFHAYREAAVEHLHQVDLIELILATVGQDKTLQNLLVTLGINSEKLNHVVLWVRLQNQIRERWLRFNKRALSRPKGETNRVMTALATPYLDRYSRDLTYLASRGALEICVGRVKETEEIFRIFTSGARGVVLVGPAGVGKRSIIEGIAEKMINEDVPEVLSDKRLIELHLPALLSGANPAEASERLLTCLWEAQRSGNIVMVIPNLDRLIGISVGNERSLDLADVLINELQQHGLVVIATADPEPYRQAVGGTVLGGVFQKVSVEEADFSEAVEVLESKAHILEYRNQVFFSYEALAKAVELASKFLTDAYLPASALELLGEAAVVVRNQRGKNRLVNGEDVATIVSSKVHVPITAVTQEEVVKLLRLEEVMHSRVIGQDEAVNLVAAAMRRARAGVRNTKRPVATFLFLGPTGVGKTETAKTLAEVYYGKEEQMIRLDMSEYQDKNSIYRLIGMPGERGTGILTEAIKEAPASLVLLDELEKADPGVLNIFLQVMDDGRLTDSLGQTRDFTNAIIIATSNAGTSYVQEQLAAGVDLEKVREQLLHGELQKFYRPEFINRFDAVVLFKPLNKEDVKKIAVVNFAGISKRLKEEKEIEAEATSEVIEEWANLGFDSQFGARPLRRVLREKVEDKIAELLLKGEVNRNQKIIFSQDGIKVENK